MESGRIKQLIEQIMAHSEDGHLTLRWANPLKRGMTIEYEGPRFDGQRQWQKAGFDPTDPLAAAGALQALAEAVARENNPDDLQVRARRAHERTLAQG